MCRPLPSVDASRVGPLNTRTSSPVRLATELAKALASVLDTASEPNCLPLESVGAARAGASGGIGPADATIRPPES